MGQKNSKPVTFCTVCNAPGYDITLVNGPCDRRTSKEICLGIIQSAIGLHDWQECPRVWEPVVFENASNAAAPAGYSFATGDAGHEPRTDCGER